jgi:hypothetical protein
MFSIECYMASVVGDVPNLPNSTTTTNPTSAKIFHHVPIYYTTIYTALRSARIAQTGEKVPTYQEAQEKRRMESRRL